jgi:hypothetical protein
VLTLRLDISLASDGAWLLALSDGQGQAQRAVLGADEGAAILREVHDILGALPILPRRGHDAARTAVEEQAGRCLARVFTPAPLARALAWAQGNARARSVPLALVVDAPDLALRGLPWELLAAAADEPPLEESGAAFVARLAEAGGRQPTGHGSCTALRLLTWCPTPRDPACQAVLEHLAQLAAAHDLPAPLALDPAAGVFPPRVPSTVDVLHVVCHGRVVADEGVLLAGPGDERAVGTAAHLLAAGLPGLALVVLDVCRGGSPTSEQLGNLAGRLVAAGAPACVAPRHATHVDAVRAFARGLHGALAAGEPILMAVAAGRREVRGLADPHLDARWNNATLLVAALDVPSAQPVTVGWTPSGWPQPNGRTAALLERARALALEQGGGFLGLHHLAAAFVEARLVEPALCRLQVLLPPAQDARWSNLLRGLRRLGPRSGEPELTPRLRVYGVLLASGFDLTGLMGLIVADPNHGLHLLASRDLREGCGLQIDEASQSTLSRTVEFRWEKQESQTATAAARALQVVWGPEDGRVLVPRPGDVLGRWDAERPPSIALYQGCGVVDRHLHRAQLTWLGEGRLQLWHEARRIRGRDEETLPAGPIELLAGDLLQLSPATWLRALASLG